VRGPSNYLSLLVNRASMTGMLVFDFADRYAEGRADLARWFSEGRIIAPEHMVRGDVGDFPDVLLMLFSGQNTGKLILELDRD
jgi:NADPH-dependent curcumin reductase CurA